MNKITSALAACLLAAPSALAIEGNQRAYNVMFDYGDNFYKVQLIPAFDRETNYIYLRGNEGWSHIQATCHNHGLVHMETNGENHPPELQRVVASEWCRSSFSAQTDYWE